VAAYRRTHNSPSKAELPSLRPFLWTEISLIVVFLAKALDHADGTKKTLCLALFATGAALQVAGHRRLDPAAGLKAEQMPRTGSNTPTAPCTARGGNLRPKNAVQFVCVQEQV
jgi:hypothetical protein